MKGNINVKVLLIEDEIFLREYIQTALVKKGYEVNTASDMESGLLSALHQQPDIIIADYNIPDGSGIELVDKLQQSGKLPTTHYIVMSGHSESYLKRYVINGKQLQATFLHKPFTMAELQAILAA